MLMKMTDMRGINWDLEVLVVLWAYRTPVKTGTQFSPYHLVYGKEATMPIEMQVLSLRMLKKLWDEPPDYFMERVLTLQEMQLDRGRALEYYMKCQETQIEQSNKQVTDKNIEKGDLVLRYNSGWIKPFKRSFRSNGKVPSKW